MCRGHAFSEPNGKYVRRSRAIDAGESTFFDRAPAEIAARRRQNVYIPARRRPVLTSAGRRRVRLFPSFLRVVACAPTHAHSTINTINITSRTNNAGYRKYACSCTCVFLSRCLYITAARACVAPCRYARTHTRNRKRCNYKLPRRSAYTRTCVCVRVCKTRRRHTAQNACNKLLLSCARNDCTRTRGGSITIFQCVVFEKRQVRFFFFLVAMTVKTWSHRARVVFLFARGGKKSKNRHTTSSRRTSAYVTGARVLLHATERREKSHRDTSSTPVGTPFR